MSAGTTGGLQGRARLMETVYDSLILCWTASGNSDAKIFQVKEGRKTKGLMVHISVILSVWPYSGG